jgi:hypothetical protein
MPTSILRALQCPPRAVLLALALALACLPQAHGPAGSPGPLPSPQGSKALGTGAAVPVPARNVVAAAGACGNPGRRSRRSVAGETSRGEAARDAGELRSVVGDRTGCAGGTPGMQRRGGLRLWPLPARPDADRLGRRPGDERRAELRVPTI